MGEDEATLKDWVLTKGLPAYYEDPETGILRPIDFWSASSIS